MRKVLIAAVACIHVSMSPSANQWIQIRHAYRLALSHENHVSAFEAVSKTHSSTDPLAKAYHATALALRARASISPPTKLSLANQSQQLFNSAAAQQPQNLEIRFLRYSFEYGTPPFLNLKKNMQTDKPLALQFAKTNSPIKDIAIAFFKDCDELSAAEKSALR